MRIKSLITFVLAVLVSLAAATYRWGDSSHAIGLMSKSGGKTRHPSFMQSGWDRYTQITTATVLPPYRGDVSVSLEGYPPLDYEIRFSAPVIDLGIRRLPVFKDNIIHDLKPKDRLALWVLMHSFPIDPVCGMAVRDGDISFNYNEETIYFCADTCLEQFKADPQRFKDIKGPRGKYNLAFYDTRTGQSVLNVPLIFKSKEETPDASCEHH